MALPTDVSERHETCDACGAPLRPGDWPWCPHGTYVGTNIDDQIPGGPRFFENLGAEEVYIETKSQLRRECKARGLVPFVRHVERDAKTTHTSRWV